MGFNHGIDCHEWLLPLVKSLTLSKARTLILKPIFDGFVPAHFVVVLTKKGITISTLMRLELNWHIVSETSIFK
ncbi:hypothetical protein [Shewanella kaireitica]|uniref:hypothetical protein n=1 Tax=Shewanella kaireitica TaxID=212021 RepID=UPI00200E893D|nr:hypothetical protein [Shewanella kaireitica]MCL1094281.1 hypothetical protein [Shewanella kaireitica]